MSVVEEILQSPNLPGILEQLHKAWLHEKALRRKFYEDITPERKWEFINGEVIMHSPALNRHLQATQLLHNLFYHYVLINQCGVVRTEKALCAFSRNDYEPDIVFFGLAKSALLEADTLRFPAPDLIVEVLSPSTESIDRGIKFKDYASHGVQEYWMVDTVAEAVEIYRLQNGQCLPAELRTEGALISHVIAGLEIEVRSVFDEAVNLQALKKLLDSSAAG